MIPPRSASRQVRQAAGQPSGLGYFYCSNRHTLGPVFRADLFEPHRVAVYEAQIADMAVAYLKPAP